MTAPTVNKSQITTPTVNTPVNATPATKAAVANQAGALQQAAGVALRENNAAVDQATRENAQGVSAQKSDVAKATPNIAAGNQAVVSNDRAAEKVMPSLGDTRRNAFGGTETLMPSQSGPRWVGSTTGAPPATNFRPGDSGTNSLADHVQVHAKPLAAPVTGPGGNKSTDAANLAANKAMYTPGGMSAGGSKADPLQSESIQHALDNAAGTDPEKIASAAGTGKTVQTAFGPVASRDASQDHQNAEMAKAQATPGIPGIPETQGASNVAKVNPPVPASPATTPPTGADIGNAAQVAAQGTGAAIRGVGDSVGGGLSAVAQGARTAFGSMVDTAKSAVGAVAQGASNVADDLLKKGRTAFGDLVQPLKDAISTRADAGNDTPNLAGGYMPNSTTWDATGESGNDRAGDAALVSNMKAAMIAQKNDNASAVAEERGNMRAAGFGNEQVTSPLRATEVLNLQSGAQTVLPGDRMPGDRTAFGVPNYASGIKPAMAREKAAIQHGVGGARPGDKPEAVQFPGIGPAVINSGEKVVQTAAGQPAVLNRDMMKKGRSAFGDLNQPLKRAVKSQPKRADLVHTSRWN
ncbi:MAG: hypothetical protein ABJF10_01770 [Chthoniobacter sp.]|uniref:hypothetical protein n=1 Tax=Chthoniobacter sp. TaxID=2510640 RepID=UPI0032AD89C1